MIVSGSSIDVLLLGASALILISVLSSKASGRFGIPALLLFILIGILAGSEGPGGIDFENYFLAQSIGIAALAMILFDGGLGTNWEQIQSMKVKGITLSMMGVLVTALVVGVFARYVLSFSWLEGLLLGSIISSTDAAAVFSILRSKNATLRGQTQTLLEFESGSNDPMAVFLTIGGLQLMQAPEISTWSLIPMFLQQLILGGLLGYAGGQAMVLIINRIKLEYEGLYPVLTFGSMLLLYSGTATLGGSGFLAVYIAGIVLSSSYFIHKNSLVRFHDGVAWLAQIALFLTLGLLIFPSQLIPIAGSGILLSLFLMFIARPLSVMVALPFKGLLTVRERLMVSWVGLRGAASIILATFPFVADVAKAEVIFNLVFFVVLISVITQGATIPWVAKKLGLAAPLYRKMKSPLEFDPESRTDTQLSEVIVPSDSAFVGKPIVEMGVPSTTLIVLITRGNKFVIPRGDTLVKADDVLLVLADRMGLERIRNIVETKASKEVSA